MAAILRIMQTKISAKTWKVTTNPTIIARPKEIVALKALFKAVPRLRAILQRSLFTLMSGQGPAFFDGLNALQVFIVGDDRRHSQYRS